ncbi:MAG: hypothetical protein OXM87_06850 [Truepera sp.]|nr:hypothetical protein [Truepera sp.]
MLNVWGKMMAERPIVIVHGWRDTSGRFEPLAKLLQAKLGCHISIISLANYISMDDEIRFDDLATAMQTAWKRHGLPTQKGSVDAIVHSTGGLVIRDWLQRHYLPKSAPIKHLVMLAPANFGSPLAHKGRSLRNRALLGFIDKRPGGERFETGTHILKGLELASPYTWHLANRDRFGPAGTMYQPGNVLCTVLVGNKGFRGIKAIANEDGSDGTVRLSTANMDCVRIKAEFPAYPNVVGHDVTYDLERSSGSTAFGVMDGHNHLSITLSHREGKSLAWIERKTKSDSALFAHIVKALTVTNTEFGAWRDRLAECNEALLSKAVRRGDEKHGFQNTVVHVEDQYGVGVDDYRSLYVNCTRLRKIINEVGESLSVSLTASPELNERTPVGFTTLGNDGIGGIRIKKEDIDKFFMPHRTALVTLQLTRKHSEKTFRFENITG